VAVSFVATGAGWTVTLTLAAFDRAPKLSLKTVGARIIGRWLITDHPRRRVDSRRTVRGRGRNGDRGYVQGIARSRRIIGKYVDLDRLVDGPNRGTFVTQRNSRANR